MVALGDLCDFLNGGTPSRSVDRFYTGETPWITGADITEPVVKGARSFITDEAIHASATNLVPAGTVLLVTRTSVGKVAIAGTPLCFSQDITAITPDATKLDVNYLVHFLRSKQVHLETVSRGATIKGVTREVVESLGVPLPPLPEQRRIAAILDKAAALRAKRREALKQLDELTQSIFLDMFGDPITNPKRWPVQKLDTLGMLDRGVSKHRPRNAPELLDGPYPFVQTGDVANCGGYVAEYSATYSDAGLKQSKMWPAGTLCITIAANIAKTGVLTFDACFPDSVVGFSADRATIEYVRCWLSFLQASLEAQAPESAQKNINLKILRGLDIPAPDSKLVAEFARRVLAIESLKRANRDALNQQDALFAAIQHRAFRGEL